MEGGDPTAGSPRSERSMLLRPVTPYEPPRKSSLSLLSYEEVIQNLTVAWVSSVDVTYTYVFYTRFAIFEEARVGLDFLEALGHRDGSRGHYMRQ